MPTYYVDPVNGNDANDGGGWRKLAFASGTGNQPVADETVAGAGGAAAVIIKVTGTWAISGTLYLRAKTGTFANGENITFSGGGACVNAQTTPYDAVFASFKTLKKTFAAGDIILVVKNVETQQQTGATATLGGVNVTGISGWTPAQYNFIRFVGDDTIYMVRSFDGSTLVLYRPYRGASGSKTINLLTLPVALSSDWRPTGGTGTLANPITLQAGINASTNAQDGFTIINGNGASEGWYFNATCWNLSRLGFYNFACLWDATFTNCDLTNCYAFRSSLPYSPILRVSTINGFVSEECAFRANAQDSILNNIETASPSYNGVVLYGLINSTINNWKNAGYSGRSALYGDTSANLNSRFIDCILDELASGCLMINMQGSPTSCEDIVLQNPSLGAGTIFTSNSLQGSIALQNINGSAIDHRVYYGRAEMNKYYWLSYDASTYNTAAPAAKINSVQSVYSFPVRHYIPCEAGVEKTVSVYFRKNSSYGSVTRPIMRLRWMTGSPGALVSNVHDEVMADTNDTFLEQSYAVTPSVKGAIIVELIFQSANSGAVAWFDDLAAV